MLLVIMYHCSILCQLGQQVDAAGLTTAAVCMPEGCVCGRLDPSTHPVRLLVLPPLQLREFRLLRELLRLELLEALSEQGVLWRIESDPIAHDDTARLLGGDELEDDVVHDARRSCPLPPDVQSLDVRSERTATCRAPMTETA